MEVTLKNTKQEILDAYKSAKEEADKLKAIKADPYAKQKEEEKKRVSESAKDTVESGFFNPDRITETVQRYKDLEQSLVETEARLEELTGIEKEYLRLTEMISASKVKRMELEEEMKSYKACLDAEKAGIVAEWEDKISGLKEEYKRLKEELEADYKDAQEVSKKNKDREEEQYQYDLARKHKALNDEWDDDCKKRLAELKEKERLVQEREDTITCAEQELAEVRAKVNSIPELIKEAEKTAYAKGKNEATKEAKVEIDQLKRDAEFTAKINSTTVKALEDNVASLESRCAKLEENLNASYARNQELAKAVATAGVKVVVPDNNGNK